MSVRSTFRTGLVAMDAFSFPVDKRRKAKVAKFFPKIAAKTRRETNERHPQGYRWQIFLAWTRRNNGSGAAVGRRRRRRRRRKRMPGRRARWAGGRWLCVSPLCLEPGGGGGGAAAAAAATLLPPSGRFSWAAATRRRRPRHCSRESPRQPVVAPVPRSSQCRVSVR